MESLCHRRGIHFGDVSHLKELYQPVAPDLMLIEKGGEVRFIESKMPWDTIRPNQIAGLKIGDGVRLIYLTIDI